MTKSELSASMKSHSVSVLNLAKFVFRTTMHRCFSSKGRLTRCKRPPTLMRPSWRNERSFNITRDLILLSAVLTALVLQDLPDYSLQGQNYRSERPWDFEFVTPCSLQMNSSEMRDS